MNEKNKVFCLGFSKTGTTSMEQVFKILGYKVCEGYWNNNHTFYLLSLFINKDYNELLRMTNYWDAFADGPWGGTDLYVQLIEKYPNAKYILTEREPESWYKSFEKLITMFDLNLETALKSYHENGMYGSGYYFETLFNIKILAGNKQKIIDTYLLYNKKVKEFFEDKKKELLIIDLLKENNRWEQICSFLNCDIPTVPFPHANKAEDNPYLSNYAAQKKSSENNPTILDKLKKIIRKS